MLARAREPLALGDDARKAFDPRPPLCVGPGDCAEQLIADRHGCLCPVEPICQRRAAGFAFTTIGKLTRRRLITVRPRRAPRRYEVQLTADGRAAAAAALALQAEALAAGPGGPLA